MRCESILNLCREVGEIECVATAVQHFLSESALLLGAEVASLWGAQIEPTYFRPASGSTVGLDSSQASFIERWYFTGNAHMQDPITRRIRQTGSRGVYNRRCLMEDRAWYRDPATAEKLHQLGLDDLLVGARPLQGGVVFLTLHRSAQDRPFGETEMKRLEELLDLSAWFFRAACEHGLLSLKVGPKLPPRLQGVLVEMLRGKSEKDLAGDLGLSPRTVHKYIEQLYRVYGVSSRPELMALWIPALAKQSQAIGFERIATQEDWSAPTKLRP